MTESILLVEDDTSISEMVTDHLTKEGYRVIPVFDGEEATKMFNHETFDIIMLDLMLPTSDGIDILKQIRQESRIPIIILSAKSSDVDKALGLGFGADDYIAKPFSLIEMTARVKASLRRAKQYTHDYSGDKDRIIKIDNLVIDPDNYAVTKSGMSIQLTEKEFGILRLIGSHPKQVFTKAQLFENVWNDVYHGDENVINVHIRRLREKIEDHPSSPRYIQTIWGIGYKLGTLK